MLLTISDGGLLAGVLTLVTAGMTLYSMCEYVWQNRAVLGGAR